MAALNNLNKKHTGLGNHSQLILILKGYLDQKDFANKLSITLSDSNFLKGKIRRAWNLAPFWVSESVKFNPSDMKYFQLENESEKQLNKIIRSCATKPFIDDKTLLGFDLIHHSNQTYIIMKFDHKMFDARGAEALLEYILDENNVDTQYNLPAQGAKLHSWKEKFLSGQKINRFLRSIYSKEIEVAVLGQNNESNNSHNFYYTTFSKDQTSIIDKHAIKDAGYLMNGIYLLTAVAKKFDSLFKKLKTSGDILIPINVDIRATKFTHSKIFFNNVSFMLFKVNQNFSLKETLQSLKKQFVFQVKNKIPYHFMNASLLMRIMPLNLLTSFMNFRMKKNQCSFSFSYIAEQAFFFKKSFWP
ncbi:MAG: hypothetical protein CMM60_03240 [Rhodospirillaceae bacterium]|nr:hypothetical protein [Rhodospirillaceae bacterium]